MKDGPMLSSTLVVSFYGHRIHGISFVKSTFAKEIKHDTYLQKKTYLEKSNFSLVELRV